MKDSVGGQSLVESLILTASVTVGALSLWGLINGRIISFIDLVLAVVASPIP